MTFVATALLLTVFAEELPVVERASFPEGFMFGSSGAAYQVLGSRSKFVHSCKFEFYTCRKERVMSI